MTTITRRELMQVGLVWIWIGHHSAYDEITKGKMSKGASPNRRPSGLFDHSLFSLTLMNTSLPLVPAGEFWSLDGA